MLLYAPKWKNSKNIISHLQIDMPTLNPDQISSLSDYYITDVHTNNAEKWQNLKRGLVTSEQQVPW